ncbi:hypothetical protein E3N88_07244 [Mikania micrantha]|uniref:Uncharacterized protein n=1 Tax=Mikania micrantha TaxID=192012 RepID=A0A5N6PR23_9ASTR|nr:hypothetical protein E3N88_07244 [Mikania micrantha]
MLAERKLPTECAGPKVGRGNEPRPKELGRSNDHWADRIKIGPKDLVGRAKEEDASAWSIRPNEKSGSFDELVLVFGLFNLHSDGSPIFRSGDYPKVWEDDGINCHHKWS